MMRWIALCLLLSLPAHADSIDLDQAADKAMVPCGAPQQSTAPAFFSDPGNGLAGNPGSVYVLTGGQVALSINNSVTGVSPCEVDDTSIATSINIHNRQRGKTGVTGLFRIQGFPASALLTDTQSTYGLIRWVMTDNASLVSRAGHWEMLCMTAGRTELCPVVVPNIRNVKRSDAMAAAAGGNLYACIMPDGKIIPSRCDCAKGCN